MTHQWFNHLCSNKMVTVLAFVLGSAVPLLHQPFNQMELSDGAILDYCAQTVVRGGIPYRDVVENRAPGSMYLSALAIVAGRSAGLRDLAAVRLLHILLTGLLAAVVFWVAQTYLLNRQAALIALLLPLMTTSLVTAMVAGTQPKLTMVIFGMLSLLLMAKDRPLWSGFCSGLASLCWQPGLVFAGVGFLVFSHYLSRWRDRRALRFTLGAAIPFLILIVYFGSKGALGDLWTWTVLFNYRTYAPRTIRPDALTNLWTVMCKTFGKDIVLVLMSSIGLLMYAVGRIRVRFRRGASDSWVSFRDAILIIPIAYLGFSLLHFQGEDDSIPLLPFLGIFAGWFFAESARLLAMARLGKHRLATTHVVKLLPLLAMLFIFLVICTRSLSYKLEPGWTLEDQDTEFKNISDLLGPNDKIYCHGSPELLVLLNRQNLNPYINLTRGTDEYLDQHKPGGFRSVLADIESQAPKIVYISRLRNVTYKLLIAQWIDDWVEKHYDPLPLEYRNMNVYLRRD